MRIVITVEQFDPDKGYTEYYLARELTELGHKVYIFTYGWNKPLSPIMFKEGFQIISIPHIGIVNGYHIPSPRAVAYIIEFIKKEKPDIIHCQPLYSPLSLIFINCRWLSGYRVMGSLITGEYLINSVVKNLLYILAKMAVEYWIKNKIALFFSISKELKVLLLRLFNIPSQKIRVIPLGADSELFKFDTVVRRKVRVLLGLSDEDVVVVYTGKIIPSKELDVLINAIAPIIKENSKVKLLISGKGDISYMKYLKELCFKLGILNNVIFHPWVHRTKLPEIYSASDIAVWPGGPSISIVEAASVGLPVIIKRSPIEIYAIEYGNGFAFERGNVNELNEYLEALINDNKLRMEMGLKSRLLVEQKLNWKNITKQYLEAYIQASKSSKNC
ncbi:MAG: glycosyltransferase family 4 protein [Nitrososphaerota archaeon]